MKIALLFPGQGAQYIGMGKKWFDSYAVAAKTFKECDSVLGLPLSRLCFEGDEKELMQTENAQPAILAASIAAYRIYREEGGPQPHYLAGHSLGEFTSLVVSGAISFADAVQLVRVRGQLMSEASIGIAGAMSAVSGTDKELVEHVCRACSDETAQVAVSNYNSKSQWVISGHESAVSRAEEQLQASGARTLRLTVSAPFHSPLMEEASLKFKAVLDKVDFNPLTIPVVSNVHARPYLNKESIPAFLSRQIIEPVRWSETMQFLASKGMETAVELGPRKVLKNLFKDFPSIRTFAFDSEEDLQEWKALNVSKYLSAEDTTLKLISRCLAIAVCTRNRNWDHEAYQKGVLEPYRRIKEMEEQLTKEGKPAGADKVQEAIDMLRSVFETKLTPADEQKERFEQLLQETQISGVYPQFHDLANPELCNISTHD